MGIPAPAYMEYYQVDLFTLGCGRLLRNAMFSLITSANWSIENMILEWPNLDLSLSGS